MCSLLYLVQQAEHASVSIAAFWSYATSLSVGRRRGGTTFHGVDTVNTALLLTGLLWFGVHVLRWNTFDVTLYLRSNMCYAKSRIGIECCHQLVTVVSEKEPEVEEQCI